MGCGSSAVVAPPVLPNDTYPYPGPGYTHKIIQSDVKLKVSLGFTSTTLKNNDTSYYSAIGELYSQGYTLLQFLMIPGHRTAGGFSQKVKFEAICAKEIGGLSGEQWDLRVQQCLIQANAVRTGILSSRVTSDGDTSNITNAIAELAGAGGRLACVAATGSTDVKAGISSSSSSVGVDVIFNMPKNPGGSTYIYMVSNLAVDFTTHAGMSVEVVSHTDYQTTFIQQLNQGWKLIDIWMDWTQMYAQGSGLSMTGSMNSIWYFEKEASGSNDNTPRYEGCIVNYSHKVSAGMSGVKARSDWGPVIEEMGNRGWELATILTTPEQKQSGFTAVMTLKMFYQRPIL